MSSADPSKLMAIADSSSSAMNIKLHWGSPNSRKGPKINENGHGDPGSSKFMTLVYLLYWHPWPGSSEIKRSSCIIGDDQTSICTAQINVKISLIPKPHPKRRKGSGGTHRAISWGLLMWRFWILSHHVASIHVIIMWYCTITSRAVDVLPVLCQNNVLSWQSWQSRDELHPVHPKKRLMCIRPFPPFGGGVWGQV